MIGDALTDVAAGKAVGARTILMLTGVTSREAADALPEGERPTAVAATRRPSRRSSPGSPGWLTGTPSTFPASRPRCDSPARPLPSPPSSRRSSSLAAAAPGPPAPGSCRAWRWIGRRSVGEQLAAWRANGPASYTWEVEFSCECGLSGRKAITVVDGKVTRVQTPTGDVPLADLAGAPLTVDAVLEAVLEASAQGGDWSGSWSGTNGVPSELSIDPKLNTLDDELSLRVVRFDPAP